MTDLSKQDTDTSSAFDPIEFLQQLVQLDTCDPPGNESKIAALVHNQLLALGVESTLDEFQPNRVNVLGRIRGAQEKPAFVLSSHMDTVPVGTVPWKRPPFSGEVEDGKLYGRGSSDMKSALAAMVAAAGVLVKHKSALKGDVILAFTAGESSNLLGACRFVEQGLQKEIGAFLCGEPSDLDVVIVEKAVLWLRATATGRLGHVSGDPGVNAIDLMCEFLSSLKNLKLKVPSYPLLDGPTIRVGRIEGGSAVNLTPDNCIADFDVRFPPGVDPADVIAQIEEILPKDVKISTLDFKPAVESSPNDAFVQLCTSVCEQHSGIHPEIKGVSYYSDATVLLNGISAKFAIVGPGGLGQSGQSDEYVVIEKVKKAALIYADVAKAWLA